MENKSHYYFFLIIMIGTGILTFFIFYPYITSLLLASVFSVIFRPMHRWISYIFSRGKQTSSLSTFITLFIITILIVTPLILLGKQIYVESQNLYYGLTDEGTRSTLIQSLNALSASLSNRLYGVFPEYSFDSFNITKYVQSFLEFLFANLDTLFSSVSKFAIEIFIMLFALFYLLRDGGKFKEQVINLSPLSDSYDEKIFLKLKQAIRSIVVGSLAVGLIQGLLTGLGFYIFGVPNPALWGSLAVVSALIPGIGTSLVIVPGVLFLFFTSTKIFAIGLLIWGLVAVGTVDNFIGPMLVNRGVNVHPFLILLSVIGGLSYFGPIGFIAGPLVVALLFALLEIYKSVR
jgi:predicted PurR-regulated permease PerM